MSPLHFSCLMLVLAGTATPMTRKPPTITIDGERRPVESAHFGIHVLTEVWDAASKSWRPALDVTSASYSLEVLVDEHSGEDGAPAPAIQNIPVARASGGRHPSLAALGALTVRERDDGHDCDEWEAWFGNDAPGLCGNVLTFEGWEGSALRMRWQAHYDERGQQKPFAFEGLVEFTGIYLNVRRGEDPDAYLKAAWGAQPAATLDRHLLGRHDHGASFPAERRHTETYVYMPKGQPLSSYWRKGDSVAPDARR
jgi:hypothetical protein